MATIEAVIADAEKRMNKTIESMKTELTKIRTGRANVALLDHVMVDFYGTPTPIGQAAGVSVGDARTLVVKVWDKNMIQAIEKAILESDLGLNPATAGDTIRIPLPPLTEERRKDLVKVVKGEGEHGKVAVRNIRRDANTHVKELLKNKEISEDDEKRAEDRIQKLTDSFVGKIDKHIEEKEKDLMEL
ncbi:MAG: ribosome recycling factor [Gammaproteobacteria bacterium]|nr:ribosome recycling factor [Gammaproteobacteria bacterium]